MKNYQIKILSLVILSFTSISAISSTINYNEAISGEVEITNPYYLGIGNNSFNGTISFGSNVDFDEIVFILPSNSRATFNFNTSLVSTSNFTPLGGATWYLEEISSPSDSPCSLLCTTQIFSGQSYSTTGSVTDTSALYNFSNLPVLTHNIYSLYTGLGGGPSGVDFDMSYTAQINVQTVPLPPTFILFLSGLSLFIARLKMA